MNTKKIANRQDAAEIARASGTAEQRIAALESDLEKGEQYLREIAAEREKTVSELNASLAQREREIAVLKREKEEAAATFAAFESDHEEEIASWRQRLAAKERTVTDLEEERRKSAEAAAAESRQVETLKARLSRSLQESQARHEHLQFAMAELDRMRGSSLMRLARFVGRLPRAPRRALGRLSAPGTFLFRAGRKALPRPISKWIRRVLAPVPGGVPRPAARRLARRKACDALPRAPAGQYDLIVLSIIDWQFRFQRPQQIATQFSRAGHRVFYLSTTQFLSGPGPEWDLEARAAGVAELRIRSREELDVYGGSLGAADLEVFENAFASLAKELTIGDAVCLVQLPFWSPLALRLRERFGWRCVYDCMDEWTNFPGFGRAVLSLEKELVGQADLTIVSADRLLEKWKSGARKILLARNGVDLRHYRALYGENAILGTVPHPVIGYYGALAVWVDVPLLEKIARRHPDATVVLAGGHFDVDLSSIESLPNVRILGQRPYEEMPLLLWNFDVCIIPFLVNDITEATNPVKFYEYLFGGKPVVAPDLSELKPFAEVSYLARGHEEFLRQIDRALAEPLDDPRRGQRRSIAEANDWSVRYRAVDEAVRETYPLVSVVLVTYGRLELTRACLDSLRAAETWPRLEILVVDNASTDGTPQYLRSLAESDARVRCFFNRENLGFPAATNIGTRQARGEIVVLLNNDTVVPPGLIGRLVAHVTRDESIGLICPTTNFCGNEARIEPGYTNLSDLPFFAAERAREFEGETFEIAVAAMYCVAIRANVLRAVGPLDEAFGVGLFEDDDFSMRIRKEGYRVVCAQDAYVHHEGQASFKLLSPEEYSALWSRNQAHFESKWGISWEPHRTRPGVTPPITRSGSRGH